MRRFSSSRPIRKAILAFTLVEIMISVAIFGVGSIMLWETYRTSMFMVDKNVAMNEGNTNLEWAYYRMLTQLENSGALVDCANYDPTAQTFTAVTSGSWGNAVRYMQVCPITCYVKPDDSSGYTVTNPPPPTTTTYLQSTDQFVFFTYNASLYNASCIPSDARVVPTYPSITGTVTGGNSPGPKPGLAFDTLDTSVSGLIGTHYSTALGSNTFLYCNRAYFMQESAFAVITNATDGHKSLLYFPDTQGSTAYTTICQKLDGSNQTQAGDSSIPSGGTSGTFCMPVGSNCVQVLLPIRSLEFLNVMTRAGGSVARNNTWVNVNCKFRQRENPL
jgi:Tfp pilus assembly protein PilE